MLFYVFPKLDSKCLSLPHVAGELFRVSCVTSHVASAADCPMCREENVPSALGGQSVSDRPSSFFLLFGSPVSF